MPFSCVRVRSREARKKLVKCLADGLTICCSSKTKQFQHVIPSVSPCKSRAYVFVSGLNTGHNVLIIGLRSRRSHILIFIFFILLNSGPSHVSGFPRLPVFTLSYANQPPVSSSVVDARVSLFSSDFEQEGKRGYLQKFLTIPMSRFDLSKICFFSHFRYNFCKIPVVF